MSSGFTEPATTAFPEPGEWTEEGYLAVTNSTNKLVELSDGELEVLTIPTQKHQFIADYVGDELKAFVLRNKAGRFIRAPFRIKLREGKFREPDLAVMLAANLARTGNQYWTGADLVVEIVSDGERDRERDTITKRAEYAAAGISEYWIIDPEERAITVLSLGSAGDTEYRELGRFSGDNVAASSTLPGFTLGVSRVFAAGDDT